MIPSNIRRFLLLATLTLPCPLALGQGNLTGIWAFDPARKQVYIDSVNAGRRGAPMSEIAAAMGLARIENSLYELGANLEGPFLSITDKTSQQSTLIRLRVTKSATELILTGTTTSHRYRLRPVDPSHIDLVDEQQGVTIPLTRR